MDRGKVARWGAAGAVAVAAVVMATIALPALAGVNRSPDPAAGGETGNDQLAAMETDLGLTEDQAVARLEKEAWATDLSARLRSDLGTGFAGAWLNADATDLMVGVTNLQAAARARAAGANPKLVSRNEAELDALKGRLDRAAATDSDGVTGWYVDVTANSVVVTARPGAERVARNLIVTSGVPDGTAQVVVADETPEPLFDLRGGDAFTINGRARCSVGFSVQGGFVTAGHCGKAGNPTNGFNNAAQGTFRASSFPGDDFAFVEVNNDWTPRAVVATVRGARNNNQQGSSQGNNNQQRNRRQRVVNVSVAGSKEAPVGASVCRTGSTTGTRCGVVKAKNATVRYQQGVVTGLTRTTACAEPGDSGGPFMSGNQAQGLTSGGSGNCRVGGVTFFQPINEVLAKDKLKLVTANAGQGQGQNKKPPASQSAAPSQSAVEPSGSPKPKR